MKVTLIYKPEERERMLFKRCVWVTMGKTEAPKEPPSSGLLRRVLHARHSPIRVLNFAFLIEDIPSNTATHLARHIHAVPFVSSLRNDRQNSLDGDAARRDTPVLQRGRTDDFRKQEALRTGGKAYPGSGPDDVQRGGGGHAGD